MNRMGYTLITTRSSVFGRQFGITKTLCLEPLDEASSIHLLLDYLKEPVVDNTVGVTRVIVQKLGRLPVAISQIACYIVESGCKLYEGCGNIKILHASSVPASTMRYQHTRHSLGYDIC